MPERDLVLYSLQRCCTAGPLSPRHRGIPNSHSNLSSSALYGHVKAVSALALAIEGVHGLGEPCGCFGFFQRQNPSMQRTFMTAKWHKAWRTTSQGCPGASLLPSLGPMLST